jgi:hypothetical protein
MGVMELEREKQRERDKRGMEVNWCSSKREEI